MKEDITVKGNGHKIIIKQINKIMSVTREFKIFIIQNSICKTCVNVM